MRTAEIKTVVGERIQLIKQLIEAKEHFRGVHLLQDVGRNESTHPFRHYAALRIYLALTCFDILGQPDEWMDFQSWLKSNKKKTERDTIFLRHEAKEFEERLAEIHKDYNSVYGVRNSFYRFLRHVLSNEDRTKLLGSIGVLKRLKNAIHYDDGSHSPPVGMRIEVTDEVKEKFLFAARNSFTHKGISYGDPSGGVFKTDEPLYLSDEKGPIWLSQNVHTERVDDEILTYQVWRWPFVLIEIIEGVLDRD